VPGTGESEWPAGVDVGALLATGWRPTPFSQFVLKVHSRCNLACDYCYMYTLADQSWRDRPLTMSPATLLAAARRIRQHGQAHGLSGVNVVLHGGEPLLAGPRYLADAVRLLRDTIEPGLRLTISLQTNGLLLTAELLAAFARLGVRVGVSLDGSAAGHDQHRRYAHGAGSHAEVTRRLRLLSSPEFRPLFAGLLCTVDLANEPVDTYEALLTHDPPMVDFLLPHGNWTTRPPGRGSDAAETPYGDWLIAVFDRWYGAPVRETRVRLLEEIVQVALGGRARIEAVGTTPTSVVVIETDGSIEQSSALKSAFAGAPDTGLHVTADPFDRVLYSPGVAVQQIGLAGLCPQCQACPLRTLCGGGLYPHRYRAGHGFRNPSVYCPDLYHLIAHIRDRLHRDLSASATAARTTAARTTAG
jgi:uncharacterized protein